RTGGRIVGICNVCSESYPLAPMGDRASHSLCHPQLGTATAWIAIHLVISRPQRLFCQRLQPRIAAKRLLYAAIFERMKADDRQSTARLQAIRNLLQSRLQR